MTTTDGPSSPPYTPLDGLARIVIIMLIIEAALSIASEYFEVLNIPSYLLIVVESILLLIWFYRAHRNLPALGATQLEFTPKWAVIWWFIPILNFWKPYFVTIEIVKSSDPRFGATDASTRRVLDRPQFILIWWVYNFIGAAIAGALDAAGGPLEFRITVLAISSAISTTLGIMVIREITGRQARKYRMLQSGGSANPSNS